MEQTTEVTVAGFLLARIAEDEASALEAQAYEQSDRDGPRLIHVCDYLGPELADHIARHGPARVLAECEAKRRIVEEHAPWLDVGKSTCPRCRGAANRAVPAPCPTLRALASVYANHPDYRQEWRP